MTGGINRFEKEASLIQTVDALDVVEQEGDLRRRPAFKSITQGALFDSLKGDIQILQYQWSGSAPTGMGDLSVTQHLYEGHGDFDRDKIGGDLTASAGGILLVGFSGPTFNPQSVQDLPNALLLASVGQFPYSINTTDDEAIHLIPQLITGADLTDEDNYTTLPWFLDTTRQVAHDNGADETTRSPLSQDGLISWHDHDAISDWPKVTLNSESCRWIALNLSATPYSPNDPGTLTKKIWDTSPTYQFRCFKPGFEFKRLGAVEHIAQTPGGKKLFFGGRRKFYGQEKGAAAATWHGNQADMAEQEHFVEDYGSGVIGAQTIPAWTSGAGSATKGTDDYLTKNDESYSWFQEQFTGNILETIDTNNFSSADTTQIRFTSDFALRKDEFVGCIIYCESGANAGEYRLIYSTSLSAAGGIGTVLQANAWGATPLSTDVYRIYSPPHKVTTLERMPSVFLTAGEKTLIRDVQYRHPLFWILGSANNHSVRLVTAGDDLTDWSQDYDATEIDTQACHWQIIKELTYKFGSGRWTSMFDPFTRSMLFCNGKSPILTWNGSNFQKLEASYELTGERGAVVEQWTGQLNDIQYGGKGAGESGAGLVPQSFLRTEPPSGKYITDFGGRIVVAGISGEDQFVKYSAPDAYNDIWPLIYSVRIRDQYNGPITGMATLGSELIVYTSRSIHATPAPGPDGYLQFRLLSEGMGFISHASVKEVPVGSTSALIGANADGVYILNGGQLTPLIDDWSRIVPGGVNLSALNKCCAEVSLHENLYYLAVPSRGSSTNDRIIVIDFVSGSVWLWTAPYGGVSYIGRALDPTGREHVLFGHEDGHISILAEQERDDGNVITGRAKSPPFQFGGITKSIRGAILTAKELGSSDSVTVKYFQEQRSASIQDSAVTFDEGVPIFDTVTLGSTVAEHPSFVTEKSNIKAGTRTKIFQYEISGSKQWRLRQAVLLAKPLSQRSK